MTNQRGWFSLDEVSGVPIPFGIVRSEVLGGGLFRICSKAPLIFKWGGVAALVMWIREKNLSSGDYEVGGVIRIPYPLRDREASFRRRPPGSITLAGFTAKYI